MATSFSFHMRPTSTSRVHRVHYGAHLCQWGWVARQLQTGQTLLDVGCGTDQPLAYIISQMDSDTQPALMVSVDLAIIPEPIKTQWHITLDRFDFLSRWPETLEQLPVLAIPGYQRRFHNITCLHVIEYLSPTDGLRLLQAIRSCLRKPYGILYLSTPVRAGHNSAPKHKCEYTGSELAELLQEAGFSVRQRIGTAAHSSALHQHLPLHAAEMYRVLSTWLGPELLSCVFAPLIPPDACSNSLWICSPAGTRG